MISFKEYLKEKIDYDTAKRKYPNSIFPQTTAENKREAAKKRLDRMKNKLSNNGGGESNIGSPMGSTIPVDYS